MQEEAPPDNSPPGDSPENSPSESDRQPDPTGQPETAGPPASDENPVEEIEQSIAEAGNLLTTIKEQALTLIERLQDQLTSPLVFYQLAAIAAAIGLGWLIARPVCRMIGKALPDHIADQAVIARVSRVAVTLTTGIIGVGILWGLVAAFSASEMPVSVMRIAASLLSAWIVIRLFSSLVRDPFLSMSVALVAWVAAALNVLRLLEPTVLFFDSIQVPLARNISLFDVARALVMAVVLIWGASTVSRLVQRQVMRSDRLAPSVRGLVGQLVRIGFIAAAVVLALGAIGVDLTGFAVLTGAIGVGIGFGLQSIFQNFIAGIIILMEKTLKVGDFVDLESGITGEVKEINVRSTLVTTNDNVDILVPNAEFITNRVTNWTLREVYRRIRVPFGVAYGTDKDLVKKAALEAAENVPYTLKEEGRRAPQVWLVEFGDSSLNFELVVWLTDEAVRRPGAVGAAYNWELETALAKYGIEIPFPQRDLHIIPPKESE